MDHGSSHDDEVLGKAFDLRLMRRLVRFLVPYRGLFSVCVLLILVLTGIQSGLPYISKIAIDRFLTLPWAIVTVESAPGSGAPIPLGDDRYLVEISSLSPELRKEWEISGVLSPTRYLFVEEDSDKEGIALEHPDLFAPIAGGYIASESALRSLSPSETLSLRSGAIAGLIRLSILFAIALIVRFVFGVSQVYLLQLTGQKVMYDMRREIFGHVLRLPLSYFDRAPVGRLVTRVTNDVAAINEMFTSMLVNLFRDAFLIFAVMGIMFHLEWRVALVILALFPLIVIAAFEFRRRARAAYREVRRQIARLNAYLQESISGMRIVQLFVQEVKANERFAKINIDKYKASMRQLLTFAVFRPLMSFLSSFAVAIVIWYGGLNVLRGSLSLGALTAFIQYVRMLFEPILELSQGYNILQGAMAAAERIFILLDEPEEDRGGGEAIEEVEGRIEFRNVWFAYNDEEWILKDVSFTVEPGERVAIVGPTGSGKTTIIRLLLRMYPLQKGEILLDGVPIERLDLGFLRSRMAVVLQDVFLFSGDIMDNIRLRAEIPEEEAIEAARFANADFVEDLPDGYRTEVKERGVTLSVGERQLLSFARAVAFKPEILVLDEATASIDSQTESLIQRSLTKIMEDRTSIVIAHRLSTIREADKIIVLHKGKVVEEGTHTELLARGGLYAALHRLQFAELGGGTDPAPPSPSFSEG
ncbi:ABC transporter ATP-binding protein [Candidatus Acetothermia bacterium]|nr:MAG: ABC transporter ATP-binding protein [Candidatus Acetothermia bacterium]